MIFCKVKLLPIFKVSFLTSTLLFSFASSATDCIRYDSSGSDLNGQYSIYYDDGVTIESCTDSIVLSAVDYHVLKSKAEDSQELQNTLLSLFQFDVQIFAMVELTLIMAFLTSHFAGRVVRWLGK